MHTEVKQVNEENSATIDKAKEWLNSLKASTRKPYKTAWKYFREFTGMTGDQIIEDRKNDKEHKWERKVLEFKQWLMDTRIIRQRKVLRNLKVQLDN